MKFGRTKPVGFKPGELNVYSGGRSSGKSMFASQMIGRVLRYPPKPDTRSDEEKMWDILSTPVQPSPAFLIIDYDVNTKYPYVMSTL